MSHQPDGATMQDLLTQLAEDVAQGRLVPYLGPGVLRDVVDVNSGAAIPAGSESLILAMNGGRPMAPRLMWEFPRAAMDVELKRGRSAVNRFLDGTYGDGERWSRAATHDWLRTLLPPYVIDINRDTQLQASYGTTPHTLVRGIARIAGTDYRFQIHHYDGTGYREIDQHAIDPTLPVLFKPMGSPLPAPGVYIASDADYVDYITELMGGFAIPAPIKAYREGRRYLLLGMRLTRDTERMVLSDVLYAADDAAGYALIPAPTDKERRFCVRLGIEVVEVDIPELLAAAGQRSPAPVAASASPA
jgi:hypothetical protein